MQGVLEEKTFSELKKYLPISFQKDFYDEVENIARAYPLLFMMCKKHNLLDEVRVALKVDVPDLLSESQAIKKAIELTDDMLKLTLCIDSNIPFKYRLPVIMGEFPIHARIINKAIEHFNALVESGNDIEEAYKTILLAIKTHGPSCDSDSLWQLLSMMAGWSAQSPEKWFQAYPYLLYPSDKCKTDKEQKNELPEQDEKIIPKIIESEQKNTFSSKYPFIKNYDYNFDRSGRLANETYLLLLNAFGMKLGGHFDAQVKQIPRFIPIKQLHAIIHRQLSHRIDIPSAIDFDHWIEDTLLSLGMKQILQDKRNPFSEKFVNPFIDEPISFLNPEKIKQTLKKNLAPFEALNPSPLDFDIISQYIFDLLQSFQFNPGQALGIGANWDGTINLSNESGAYAFKFIESEIDWGKRFKQISLHRQGPSEALMNVMKKGVAFELGTILTDFDYMSQLQPSEYGEVIRNAIIDNLVTDLFPEPAYHENKKYEKYQKQHVVRRDADGKIYIDNFYQPHKKGTYFGKDGNKKQTPMYRRAGTLDVQAFPRRSASSEGSRESYADNPLVPFQIQYGQSMYKCTRGHIVYDPISANQFLPDPFYGQVLRSENGDYLPFIGVIPKNYDRIFKQDAELCASFVVRAKTSACLMVHCSTFRETYEQLKKEFLPEPTLPVPVLPNLVFSGHIKHLHTKLNTLLTNPDRNYRECEKIFCSLFKNIIRSLYESVNHVNDDNIKANFIQIITSFDMSDTSRANFERLIRELIVNKPVTAPNQNYNITMDYLQELIQYFYPLPSDFMAKKIANSADAYVKSLLTSPGMRHYFEIQKKIPQANLSRKTTPSNLLSALQDGEIKHIWRHQKSMHEINMPSGYRDPEGNQLTDLKMHEKRLDKIVKTAGAALQVMKNYDVLLGGSKLISEPIIGFKQAYAKHDELKYVWGTVGGMVGVFNGIWKVSTSVPYAFINSSKWIYHNAKHKNEIIMDIENPLTISAAPGNEPGLKVRLNMQMRDYLLGLLNRQSIDNVHEKNVLTRRLITLMSLLYPDMNYEGKLVTSAIIKKTFPVFDWDILLHPFSELLNYDNLIAHKALVNTSFLQAVYACLTEDKCASYPKKIITKYYQYYALNPSQKNALFEFVTYYHHMEIIEAQKNFLDLFRFNGKYHKALIARDEIIQQIQTWNNSIYSLATTINQMSTATKKLFREALEKNDLSLLDHYQLDNHVYNFLKLFAKLCSRMDVNQAYTLLIRCSVGKMLSKEILSKKDKAHAKWTAFSQRELRHALLNKSDLEQIFFTLFAKLEKYPALTQKLNELKNIYNYYFLDLRQVQNEVLNLFYKITNDIINDIMHHSRTQLKELEVLEQAKTLLINFMDITMNAVLNGRLDQINIFNGYDIKNPLINSKAIEQWLNVLQVTGHLRSLLDQQFEQSASLDHTLWRDKCILQILEKSNPQHDRVHKTGLRSLLRIWAEHADNVTKTGELYFDERTRQPQKVLSTTVLFDGSRTMQHMVNPNKKAFTFFREPELGVSAHMSYSNHSPFS